MKEYSLTRVADGYTYFHTKSFNFWKKCHLGRALKQRKQCVDALGMEPWHNCLGIRRRRKEENICTYVNSGQLCNQCELSVSSVYSTGFKIRTLFRKKGFLFLWHPICVNLCCPSQAHRHAPRHTPVLVPPTQQHSPFLRPFWMEVRWSRRVKAAQRTNLAKRGDDSTKLYKRRHVCTRVEFIRRSEHY
jgi:hypothetical protein